MFLGSVAVGLGRIEPYKGMVVPPMLPPPLILSVVVLDYKRHK